jgi:hypothetical protein
VGAFDVWDELIRGGWAQLSQWRVDQKPESLHLDFKEATWTGTDISIDDRKNLAKNQSGFGNVDGGVLVYGAAATAGAGKQDVLKALPGIAPLDSYVERLRIHARASTIPPMPGLVVDKIESPAKPGTGVAIVYVPVTDAAPFRAQCEPRGDINDKYFMRTTTDTIVMPHQILAAMFGRRPPPRFRVGVHCSSDRKYVLLVENVGRGAAATPFVRLKVEGAYLRTITRAGAGLIGN